MIDFHAHAYPELDEQASRLSEHLPPAIGQWVRELSPPAIEVFNAFESLAAPLARALGNKSLTVESLARMRKHGSPAVHALMEKSVSSLQVPAVLMRGRLSKLIDSMDQHGIERTVLIGAHGYATNDWLLGGAMEQAGNRIVPVVTLPELEPDDPIDAWVNAYEFLAAEGARGFKIHSNMDGLDAHHPAYQALFRVANDHGLFVVLHTGCFCATGFKNNEPADPRAFQHFFGEFPKVPVCLAHMNREEPEIAWELMKQFDRLYSDTSWQPADAIRKAISSVGSDRLLLGSDWPLLHADLQGDSLSILERATDSAQLEAISRNNAVALLGEP